MMRTGGLANGEAALFSFQARDDLQGKLLLADTANPGNNFGICITSFDGSPAISTAQNDICGAPLIGSGQVDFDKWYTGLVLTGDANPLVWVWQQDDPTVQGYQTLSNQTPAAGWIFRATTGGILRLDDYSEGRVYSMTRFEYGNEQTTPKVPTDAADNNYTGIAVIWSYLKSESAYTFDGAKFTGTRKDYRYLAEDQRNSENEASQYGNLTRVVESAWQAGGWLPYRMTRTEYRPNDNRSDHYLVGYPTRQSSYHCSNVDIETCFVSMDNPIAETLSLYDDASAYDRVLNGPQLTGQKQWVRTVDQTRYYRDERYHYDIRGNRDRVTRYTGYSILSGAPGGSAQVTATCYGVFDGTGCITTDNDYGVYPVAETNAAGQVVQWGYDYGLGAPVMEMDANGATTLAWYDGLGRMTRLARPGDDYGSPSVEISYPDGYFAGGAGPELTDYEVEIWQKIDEDNRYRVRKIYSSTGLKLQTQVLEALLEDGACEGTGDDERDVTCPPKTGPGNKW